MPHARMHVLRSIRIRRSTSLRNRRALKKADCTLRCKRHIRPTSVPAKKRCSTRSHRIRRFQAARYFDATASRTAKRTGAMSLSELQDFEAGRRWRNPYWVIEMAAQADPVQLAREQLFTNAFIAELQYQRL